MTPFPPWKWDIPEYFNIAVACTDAHLGTPAENRVAVIVDDDVVGDRQLTFAELAEQTSRFAQLLRDLDVPEGERVLIRLPNCIEYAIAFLGAMKRGAIPVPTSILLTAEEVQYLARDSGATVLVTDPTTVREQQETLRAIKDLRRILVAGVDAISQPSLPVHALEPALAAIEKHAPAHRTRASDPAYLVYTSGTTGYPKGVLHAHRALLGRQPASDYWFDFAPSTVDRVLHAGKYNWTYVLGTGLMDPLYRGRTGIVHEGTTEASIWPHLIRKHSASIFIAVPTIYRQIIQKTTARKADVPSLRHCMCAGEPLSDELLAAWHDRFGLQIYEALGMSEFSYYLCETRSRPIRPGSVGFVQPGHDVRLLDPHTLEEVSPNAEGMLCVHVGDPNLMLGYWNQPEETAAAFRGEWFLTGDYARRDEDGYVWFLGRKDDLINSFGYRISPYEVERVLKDHPDVADAAVVGEDYEPGKTLVAAYVIPRPDGTLTEDALMDYGRKHLASYKAPRIVHLVRQLPRTTAGKVLRRALRHEEVKPAV